MRDDEQLAELVEGIDSRGTPTTGVLAADGRRQLGGGTDLAADPEVRRALQGEAFTVVDERRWPGAPARDRRGRHRRRPLPAWDADDLRHGVAGAWTGIIGLGALFCSLAVVDRLAAGTTGERTASRGVRRPRTGCARETSAHERRSTGPVETQELARALNGLAERITELLASERTAVGISPTVSGHP